MNMTKSRTTNSEVVTQTSFAVLNRRRTDKPIHPSEKVECGDGGDGASGDMTADMAVATVVTVLIVVTMVTMVTLELTN
jgi:hypothetical protein